MRLSGFLLLLLCFFYSYRSFAQTQGELTQSRVLILLDESSSMTEKWAGGKPKYKAADEIILRIMDSVYEVNRDVEFSLRVFGAQHTVEENNCYDTKNEVAFSRDNRTQMAYRLDDIHPLGVTPIAYALEQAAEHDLVDVEHNAYSIILITDGGESCGGNICDVMSKLIKSKVYFKPYIVSLEDQPELRKTYSCMGDYLQVTHDGDIPHAVNTIVDAFRPILKVTPSEYRHIQTIAANTPSVLKVDLPVVELTQPVDTATPVKTFKDSVVIAAAPKPEHKIKVDEPPTFPKPEKIAAIPLAHLSSLFVSKPARPEMTPATMKVDLPVIAAPVVIPAPEKVSALKPVGLKKFNDYSDYTTIIKQKPIAPIITKLPALVIDTPKPPPVERKLPDHYKIARTGYQQPRPLAVSMGQMHHPAGTNLKIPMPALVIEKPKPAPPPPAPVPPPPPKRVKPAPEKIAHVQPARMQPANVVFVIEEKVYKQRPLPPMPPVKYPPAPKQPAGKKTLPVANNNPAPTGKKLDYTVEKEDAKVTTLEVYIVNSHGQNIPTSPLIALMNPSTGKEVKSFFRTVDPDGNPDPQNDIPVGTYNVTFPEKKNLVIPNVHVDQNKRSKIVIHLKDVNLSFAYLGEPNRPVKEFVAQVIERNKAHGRVENQKCTATVQYEPGNYHIRINTFPEDKRNVDLDLDEETVITILPPGFVKFTSDTKQNVTLYKRDGDKFLPFHTLDLHDPISQHLQIQPGEYQVHYTPKGVPKMSSSEKAVPFLIKSDKETEVILN